MARLSLLGAAIFFGFMIAVLNASPVAKKGCQYSYCAYIGDPHLTPFSEPYSQYWCKKTGWELLLSNEFVTIYVLVQHIPGYYIIVDYILVFPGSNSCTSFGNQWGVPTCTDPNDPVWVSLLGNTIIYHHKTQCLTVKIVKSGYRFDIYIWQGDCLAEKSCGVCVKWNCELERRVPNPPPVIPKICDQFVNVAQKRAVGPVNPNVLDQARTTCINDVNAQFDANAALVVPALVIQDAVKDLLDDDIMVTVMERNCLQKLKN